jgi:hypothetical protein
MGGLLNVKAALAGGKTQGGREAGQANTPQHWAKTGHSLSSRRRQTADFVASLCSAVGMISLAREGGLRVSIDNHQSKIPLLLSIT